MAHGDRPCRSWAAGVRRRNGRPHLFGSPPWLRACRPESVLRDPEEPRQEHDAAYEPPSRRDGAIDGRGRRNHLSSVLETYVERLLAPALRPGQVVVMDNLGAHRPKRVRELIEERGCELIYLPPYSPDLNPIEEALSKIKHCLRKIAARTKESLIEAIGRALAAVSPQDVRGFFVHCGYRTPAQQL